MKGLWLRDGIWYARTTVKVGKISMRLRESSGLRRDKKDQAEAWLRRRIAAIETSLIFDDAAEVELPKGAPIELNANKKMLRHGLTTNSKGMAGEAVVIQAIYEAGYTALRPFDATSPYDVVIADQNHSLRRIQVKYRTARDGVIYVPLVTITRRAGLVRRTPIKREFVDGFAVYCPDNGKVYFLAMADIPCGRERFAIRLSQDVRDPSVFFVNWHKGPE